MTETAKVVEIKGQRITVVPLNLDVCLGCSNEQCKSEGSLFTVVNRRKLPLSVGSTVRVGAKTTNQVTQGFVSVGIPFGIGALCYAVLPLCTRISGTGLHSGLSIGSALLTAALLARFLRIEDTGFPEITAVIDS